MPIGGGIPAGKAFVEFLVNDSKFKKGLAAIGSKLQSIGRIGAAATAPLIAGFAAAVKQFSDVGGALDDMKQRTGVSVEALSGLVFAAEQAGASGEKLEKAFAGMSRALYDAGNGSAAPLTALRAIGVTLAELQGLKPEDQMKRIADGLRGISSESTRGAIAQKLFGKSGRDMLPMLSLGAEGMAELEAQARELGFTLSNEDAAAAAELGDAIGELWNQFKGFSLQVGAAIAGPLTEWIRSVQPIIAGGIEWVRNNRVLVVTIAAVTAAIAAASTALITFGVILGVITAHPIIATLTAIAALVIGIATYFGLAGDSADAFSGKVAGLKAEAGLTDTSTVDNAALAAESQAKLQAAIGNVGAAAPAPVVDSPLLRQQLGELTRWSEETAKGIRRLVTLAQSGEAGFFSIGSG